MTDKELRKLKRTELLELLIDQMEENERLRKQLEQVTAQLNDRRIILRKAGSIANAALELNKVFEAAEEAARQYVESVRHLAEEQAKQTVPARRLTEAYPVENAKSAVSAKQKLPVNSIMPARNVSSVRKQEEINCAKGKPESVPARKPSPELKKIPPKNDTPNR